MSVLIKGFEMPKDGCKDCAMVKRGKVFDICPFLKQEVNGNVERGGKPYGCPLVQVPDTDVGDTIYRQAAIDAILHNQEVYSNNFGNDPIDKYTIAIIDNDAQTIAQLPSAQPTYKDEEIQKMQDLEQAQIEKAYQLGYEEGKKDAQPEQRWIPVTERLPKPNEEDELGFIKAYLVQDGRWMDVARWDGGFWVAWGYGIKLNNVTAWMPLPKPWRGENK